MDTVRYVLAVLLVVSLPPGLAWWFIVHPLVGFWRRVGMKWAFWTVGVASVSGMGGLFIARRSLVGPDLGLHWPLFAAGACLVVVAGFMGVKRKRHLTFRILAGVPELEPDGRGGVLLTEGPYARVRHPRYAEVVVAALAYALMANHVGGYVLLVLMLPVLHAIVLLEERELTDRFGDAYEEYRRNVPRYVPKVMSSTSATGS